MGFERLVIGPAVTLGTNPLAGVIFPHRSFNFGRQSEWRQSTENTYSLNPLASRETGRKNAGDINFEMRLGVINAYLKVLTLSAFSAPLAITGNISATASDNSFNGTGLFTSVVKGQWVWVGNLHADFEDSSGRPLPHLVIDKPSNDKIIVATDILTDRAGSGDETVNGSYMRRGGSAWTPTLQELWCEKQFMPGSLAGSLQRHKLSPSQLVNTMRFGTVVGEILSGTMGLVGPPELDKTDTPQLVASDPPSSKIIDPVRGLPYVWIDGFAAPTAMRFSQVNVEWNNQFSTSQDIGELGSSGVDLAPPIITATPRVRRNGPGNPIDFLESEYAQVSKFACMWRDLLGQELILTLPAVNVQPNVIGVDGNTGTRHDEFRLVAEPDDDSSSPHYLVGAQWDFKAA